MKVAIIGQGYVGLTISIYSSKHFEVVGFDSNHAVVHALNQGISHIEGVESSELQRAIKSSKYRATSQESDISDCNVVVIAVPTPLTSERQPDLKFVDAACKTIGENIKHPVLVINESTSYPGTLRNFIKPSIENYSAKRIEQDRKSVV